MKRLLACIMALCISFTLCSTITNAASAESPKKYVRLLGYYYSYNSSVHTSSTSVWAYSTVGSPDRVNFPTGYFGCNARLYNSSGTLIKSSGWEYNDSASGGMSLKTPSYYQTGTFYGKSQVKFYNGNGYNTYTCNATPNVSRSVTNIDASIKTNASGLTYGSDLLVENVEETPDLIRAIGINGKEGYVYAVDLEGQESSLNEVLQYIEEEPETIYIPVYDKNGITVIDSFAIEGAEPENVIVY